MYTISKVIVLVALLCSVVLADLVNTKVERSIDLTSQLARHSISVTVENQGTSAESKYSLALTGSPAFLRVTSEDPTHSFAVENGTEDGTEQSQRYTVYNINLGKGIAAGASITLHVAAVYSHSLKPFPAAISQFERQLVRYTDNHFFFSPYSTTNQKTTIKLASGVVEHHSTVSPTKVSGDTMTCGPYNNIKPFTHQALSVHFENNAPFVTVTGMVKELEVSHWGNIAVEQYLDVRHDGATLKGHFSRFDFQRNPGGSPSAVLQLTEVLPEGAADVYYRDDIGNISTSSFSVSAKGLELHLVPRFPLFGGWKNNFYMGYNLPLHQYLYYDDSQSSTYVLNATFGPSLQGSLVIDDFTFRVILPEGAKDVRFTSPFSVDSQSQEKHFTYLDTSGRTVLVVKKSNVVPEHNQYVQITYRFSALSMLHEPLLVACAFFALLLSIMFFVRFSLNISPAPDRTGIQVHQEEVINSIKSIASKLNAEVGRLATAASLATDVTSFRRQRPTASTELLAGLASQFSSAKLVGEEFFERVRGYHRAQVDRLNALTDLHELNVENKTPNKVKKSKYEREKDSIEARLTEVTESIQDFAEDYML